MYNLLSRLHLLHDPQQKEFPADTRSCEIGFHRLTNSGLVSIVAGNCYTKTPAQSLQGPIVKLCFLFGVFSPQVGQSLLPPPPRACSSGCYRERTEAPLLTLWCAA